VISFLDQSAILRQLKSEVEALKQVKPEVEAVWLFGSFVAGKAVPGSDVDLLLVLSAHPLPRWFDRVPEYVKLLAAVPCDVDVFPLTKAELTGSRLAREALRLGVQLA
jgi:predicted nucleotidyltransferase